MLPAELEQRIAALERTAKQGRDFDASSWWWLLTLGVLLPIALLCAGWWW